MPVLMERGAAGRSFSLLPGVRCAPLNEPLQPGGIEVGIVNNMPDAALESTERQFIGLLAAASEKTQVRVRLFATADVPRGDFARRYVSENYADIDELWNTRLDGLIVTGTEPRCAALSDEPYWGVFTRLVDWAEQNTTSTIWSCLAAHAAVLHLDGIERRALADKCFGTFQCDRTRDHFLMNAGAARLQVPHSRWNDLPENALRACGYEVLSKAPDIGVDMFVKQAASLFVFLQGHPEYEPASLAREYRRDVGRYLRGERATYPAQPQRYFDQASAHDLDIFRARALVERSEKLLESFPAATIRDQIAMSWHASAVHLYRNWLACIVARRTVPLRTAPTAIPELIRR